MSRAWWVSRAGMAVLATVGLLLVSTGSAVAGPDTRNFLGRFVAAAGVYPDRGGESWYCSLLGMGCGPRPVRPASPDDHPVWTGRAGQEVQIHCWKGNYYLVRDRVDRPWGWAVADRAVRPYGDGTGGRRPDQCTLLDEAG